jgi:hypothetical protein
MMKLFRHYGLFLYRERRDPFAPGAVLMAGLAAIVICSAAISRGWF